MGNVKNRMDATNRREFLVCAGTAIGLGTFAVLTGYRRTDAYPAAETAISERIEHNASLCAGCGVCGLMCSLYHEKESNVVLSRSELVRDPFEAVFSLHVCRQCPAPTCYESCPQKDSALCIDSITGVKYVNSEKCDGCGECVRACRFKPARVRLVSGRTAAVKCDLCRGREKGPICIEYCGQKALALVPGSRV